MLETLRNGKPNLFDSIGNAAICIGIGYYHGWFIGLFCLGVLITLNQIFWILCDIRRKLNA